MKYPTPPWCLLALLLSLIVPTVQAQSGDDGDTPKLDSGRIRLTHTYEALLTDPHLLTGRLLDAALPLADPSIYDGKPDPPTTDPQAWSTAYATLLMAGGPNQAAPLIPLGEVRRRLDMQPQRLFDAYAQPTALIDLMMAVVPYERVRPDALDKKLLSLTQPDSQLVAAAGSESPFLTAEAVLGTSSREVAYGPDVLFRYLPDLFFLGEAGKSTDTYGTLTVDFGDGSGYHVVQPGTMTLIKYAKTQDVVLRFRLTSSAGQVRYAASRLSVVVPAVAARPSSTTGYDAARGGNNRSYHFPLNDPLFVYHEAFPDPDPTFNWVSYSVPTPWPVSNSSAPTNVPYIAIPDGATVTVSYGGGRNIGTQVATAPSFRKPIIIRRWSIAVCFDNCDCQLRP